MICYIEYELGKVWSGFDCFQISDEGGWIAGAYSDHESALKALEIAQTIDGHEFLSDLSEKINTRGGLIATGDLKGWAV